MGNAPIASHCRKVEAWSEEVLRATSGAGADVILDPVGGTFWRQNAEAAAVGARWVLYGSLGGVAVDGGLFAHVLRKRLHLVGTTLRSRDDEYKAALVARFAAEALPHLASGRLRVVVDRVMLLSEVQAAHDVMESNATTGKVVLRVRTSDAAGGGAGSADMSEL